MKKLLGLAMGAFVSLVVTLSPAMSDGAVLTVTGAIERTNRAPSDPFTDVLFARLEVSFGKAYAFTREELASLPQAELSVVYPDWPGPVTVRGPLLSDVLKHVGARGQKLWVRAVDGYAPEFSLADIEAGRFVLAIEAGGTPLGIGGRGPVWLVFPPASYEGQPEDDGGLTWAAFHIAVE